MDGARGLCIQEGLNSGEKGKLDRRSVIRGNIAILKVL